MFGHDKSCHLEEIQSLDAKDEEQVLNKEKRDQKECAKAESRKTRAYEVSYEGNLLEAEIEIWLIKRG